MSFEWIRSVVAWAILAASTTAAFADETKGYAMEILSCKTSWVGSVFKQEEHLGSGETHKPWHGNRVFSNTNGKPCVTRSFSEDREYQEYLRSINDNEPRNQWKPAPNPTPVDPGIPTWPVEIV